MITDEMIEAFADKFCAVNMVTFLEANREEIRSALQAALAEAWNTRTPAPDRLREAEELAMLRNIAEAARGLCFGSDWNNGNQVRLHGYREKLIRAVTAMYPNHPCAREAMKGGE